MSGTFRIAPSPTGRFHLGTTRTAVISRILAEQSGSAFILRLEDTDVARSTKEFEQNILDSMEWLGLTYTGPVLRQSRLTAEGRYKELAELLLKNGLAYYCGCSMQDLQAMRAAQIATKSSHIGYTGLCRTSDHTSGILRLNIDACRMYLDDKHEYGGKRDFHYTDHVFGVKHIDIRSMSDVVLARPDGSPTYIFANTVDDLLSGVTHIVRGSDINPQTPIQILLRMTLTRLLSLDQSLAIPEYSHLSLVLDADNGKLSKRDPKTKAILDYKAEGYLPDAIIQFVTGLGNTSISYDQAMSHEEVVRTFDVAKSKRINVAFSEHMLRHVNKLHIRATADERLCTLVKDLYGDAISPRLMHLYKERAHTLEDISILHRKVEAGVSTFKDKLEEVHKNGYKPIECKEFRATSALQDTPPLEELYIACHLSA